MFANNSMRAAGDVVEAPRRGVSCGVKRLCCLILALMCALWITPIAASAADTATFTNDITDPQNLLGANASKVSDAMKRTEEQYGVHVRLQYVETFDTDRKATEWACDALEDTEPQPNTVLLAVASGDGNLAVCVSSNSDEWLRDQKTVDALSEAATRPLANQGKQDWAGSATSMMDEIAQRKRTSTTSGMVRIGVIAMGGVLVVLVVIVVAAVVVRRRRASSAVSDAGSQAGNTGETSARPMTRRERREASRRGRGLFRR